MITIMINDRQLTKNFKLSEFIYSDKAIEYGINEQFSPPKSVEMAIEDTANRLQGIRDRYSAHRGFDVAMKVSSGWRCDRLNVRVGGSRTSAHLDGNAADVKLLINRQSASKDEYQMFYDYVKDNEKFDQLINEYDFSWVHIGFREDEGRFRQMVFNIL